MRRKITERLLEWKHSNRKTCLVLKGARQVGKTYILREFGRENYDSLVYFDLSRDETARRIFDGSLDAENLIMGLSTIVGESKLIPGRTLIFLDEIQDCPRARTSLKSFADDGRYDVVASGSLLGLRMNDVPDYPVGYEEVVEMHPMDFEEFMWALGTGTEAIEHIRGCIRDRKPIGQPILDIMTRYLRWYCIVGGMPAAVETFASERKFDNVHTIHSDILSSYMDDVSKHAPASQRTNVAGCFRSIAVQLAREGRRFMYSRVEPTEPSSAMDEVGDPDGDGLESCAGSRDYSYALNWLQEAGISVPCFNVSQPAMPLEEYTKEGMFKLYMMDTGLLLSRYSPGVRAGVFNGDMDVNRGSMTENLIAQMLTAQGYVLRYFHREVGSDGGRDRIEIDFLVSGNRGIAAIEVKSGSNRNCRSLNKCIAIYDVDGIMFETRDIFVDDKGIVHYPLFAAAFMDCIDPPIPMEPDFGIVNQLNRMF